MLAAVFKRKGVLEIEDRPQPKGLGEEEVLLEVEGSGVCGTDLHILSDPPGHPATEGVGNQFATCLKVAARTGIISLFGVNRHAAPAIPQYDITRKELTIVGSFVGRNMFPRSIAVLESRILDLSKLISHDISVSGMPDAIQDARQGKAMKILVRPEEKE